MSRHDAPPCPAALPPLAVRRAASTARRAARKWRSPRLRVQRTILERNIRDDLAQVHFQPCFMIRLNSSFRIRSIPENPLATTMAHRRRRNDETIGK